ncbi:phosphatase PAP2 family protein [Pelistega indica]|uniref:phosphatase PAP2 family protein n=1 Tax=Pelistega indica TaxID=1414851 RepID=UPI0004288012|nr:phosphatase PAP2 family protein [Pelistega indica]
MSRNRCSISLPRFSPVKYAELQKPIFLYLNAKLSQFPQLQYNLTQLGNVLIAFSLLSLVLVYLPKIWEALASASICSAILSNGLKRLFEMPRPAQMFSQEEFVVIGEVYKGFNSLPSGHSITIATTLFVLVFALRPKNLTNKLTWFIIFIIIGLGLALSRVAIGAHYPLDVLIGCTIGYFCAALGILTNQKYHIWSWIANPKYYPFFIILFTGSAIALIKKMISNPLAVYYIALICLLISLSTLIKSYALYIKHQYRSKSQIILSNS